MGRLSMHMLDTVSGEGAGGINEIGRTPTPLHFFEVPKTSTRYHLTLVAAPWGYTTYRWKE